jgi:hypothetical protein
MLDQAVECYSGHTFAQEPRIVIWQGQRHAVACVERRWRTPDGPGFCIRSEEGCRFELHYHEARDGWTVRMLAEDTQPGTPGPSIGRGSPALAVAPGSTKDRAKDEEVQL